MQYTLISNGDEKNLVVFGVGPMPLVAHSSHPNFDAIIAKVEADDTTDLEYLFDVSQAAKEKFSGALSADVEVKSGRVYFKGAEIDNSLTKQVRRFLEEGVEDWKPLVRFMEKVESNPQVHSREQLYRWLERHDFTITSSGDFVGYKGVDTDLRSIHSGPGIVNGEPMRGKLPNDPGNVVEIARTAVHHDPSVGCSTGLHVGTHAYAASFGKRLLEVHVNPADVVSVPTDCGDAKVRTCRYTVVKEITGGGAYDSAVVQSDEDLDNDWDEIEVEDIVAEIENLENALDEAERKLDAKAERRDSLRDECGRFAQGRPGSKRGPDGRFSA